MQFIYFVELLVSVMKFRFSFGKFLCNCRKVCSESSTRILDIIRNMFKVKIKSKRDFARSELQATSSKSLTLFQRLLC